MKKGKQGSFLQENKKSIFILAAFLILLIGGSFAWFTLTIRGDKPNVITAGTLTLTLDESATEGINITNAYPMTDSEGMDNTKNPQEYTYTLKNEGDIASNYTVTLIDTETTVDPETNEARTRMADSVVKYNMTKTEYTATGAVKSGPNTTLDVLSSTIQNGKRILDTGILQPNEYVEYKLKVWMSYSAGNEYQNTSFNTKLNVEGSQVRRHN